MATPSKLNFAEVEKSFRERPERAREQLPILQTAIFVAAGGGMIGDMFATQPADAYRDTRCGRGPYNGKEVANMQGVLISCAKALDLDPHHLPDRPWLHNCGVW